MPCPRLATDVPIVCKEVEHCCCFSSIKYVHRLLRVWGNLFLDCKSKPLIKASRKSSSRYCSALTAWDEQSFEWISELGDYCRRLSAACCVRVASRCLAKKSFLCAKHALESNYGIAVRPAVLNIGINRKRQKKQAELSFHPKSGFVADWPKSTVRRNILMCQVSTWTLHQPLDRLAMLEGLSTLETDPEIIVN